MADERDTLNEVALQEHGGAQPSPPSVDEEGPDKVAVLARVILSNMPLVGGPIAELVTRLIPNQRMERVASFLQILDRQLALLECTVAEKLNREEFADLFEDAVGQASRTASEERRRYIANFLASSLTREDLDRTQRARLLELLGSVSDSEIILLKYYSFQPETVAEAKTNAFTDRHSNVLFDSNLTWGDMQSDPEGSKRKMNDDAFRSQSLQHLLGLGLVELPHRVEEERLKNWLTGSLGERKHGRLRTLRMLQYEITHLGRSLLAWIESDDFSIGAAGPDPEGSSESR